MTSMKGADMSDRTVIVDPEPFECVPHGLLLDTNISANTLRVYLILRKHRDYETGQAWPGLAKVGKLIGMSSRTVQRCISELVEAGYVCVRARFDDSGGRTSNLYHVHFDQTKKCDYFTPSDTSVATPMPDMTSPPTTPVSTELRPIFEQDPMNEKDMSDTHFDEFWKAYPRKESKGAAKGAWKKALTKTDASVLVTAAIEYRKWNEAQNQEQRFIKMPATWLNQECWTDERVFHQPMTNMQAHIALVRELWENDSQGYPQLEG